MVNKNETTNSEKKPIIDNDEALRLIDLIQQGDSDAENELVELGSVFIKAVAKSMWARDSLTKNSLQPVVTECYVPAISSTSLVALPLQLMPCGGCARPFCKRFTKKRITIKYKGYDITKKCWRYTPSGCIKSYDRGL